jgi:1-phosphofructokinase
MEPTVFVFAPDPILTVTVEAGPEGDEIHLHAGGQGVWVTGMLAALGVNVSIGGPFGGDRPAGCVSGRRPGSPAGLGPG